MKIKKKAFFISGMVFMVILLYLKVPANNKQALTATTNDNIKQTSENSDPNYSDHFTFMDDFMEDENFTYCHKCHDPNIKNYWEVNYWEVKDITASCARGNDKIGDIECHSFECNQDDPQALGRTHPVVDTQSGDNLWEVPDDIKENIPLKLFHLEEDKYLTCVTCHDPRKNEFSDDPMVGSDEKIEGTNKYSSYFLRRKNIDSKLCSVCHIDKF